MEQHQFVQLFCLLCLIVLFLCVLVSGAFSVGHWDDKEEFLKMSHLLASVMGYINCSHCKKHDAERFVQFIFGNIVKLCFWDLDKTPWNQTELQWILVLVYRGYWFQCIRHWDFFAISYHLKKFLKLADLLALSCTRKSYLCHLQNISHRENSPVFHTEKTLLFYLLNVIQLFWPRNRSERSNCTVWPWETW